MSDTAEHLVPMLDLDTWRQREQLTWQQVADLMAGDVPGHPAVDVSAQSMRRFGLGLRWPEADVIDRIAAITGGEVTVVSLHMRRAQWLKSSGRPRRVPVRIHE